MSIRGHPIGRLASAGVWEVGRWCRSAIRISADPRCDGNVVCSACAISIVGYPRESAVLVHGKRGVHLLMKAALKQIAHGLRCVRKLHDIKHIRHEQAAWRKRRRQRPTSPIQQWRGHIRPVVGASDGRMEVAVGWSLRVTALSSAEHIHCAYGCKDEYPSTGER